MDLFTYLGAKNEKFTLPHKNDLFAYLLGKNSKLPIQEASGTTLEITAKKTNVLELTLDKMCSQDGTPTPDNPIEVNVAEGYRNYFDSINPERSVSTGCSIVKTDSNNIVLSGTDAWSNYSFTFKNKLKNTNMFLKGIFKDTFTHGCRLSVYGTNVLNYTSGDLTIIDNSELVTLTPNEESILSVSFNSENYDYIMIRCWNNSSGTTLEQSTSLEITDIYLGLPNLPYVPYGSNYINLVITNGVDTTNNLINLGNNFIGGIDNYKDKLTIDESGNVSLVKNVGKYNINTADVTLSSQYTNIDYAIIPKPSDYLGYNKYDKVEIKCKSATWEAVAIGTWNDNRNVNMITGNASNLRWWLGFTKGTTLSDIRTLLTDSYIYYPLAESTTIDLGTIDISLFKGTNTITNSDNCNMVLKYY